MEEKVFLTVEVTLQTTHLSVEEAICELEKFTDVEVTSTKNVKVRRSEIIKMTREA